MHSSVTSPPLRRSTRIDNNDNLSTENLKNHLQLVDKSIRTQMNTKNSPHQQQDQKALINIQLEHMRLQEKYRKDLTSCQEEIELLQNEADRQAEKLRQNQNKQLLAKQQITTLHKENLKLFQQNEKQKKFIQNLKADYHKLELELERWRSDKKTFSSKLDSIYELKKNMNVELMQKNSLIEQQQARIRDHDKKIQEYKLKVEELSAALVEKERENREISCEIKDQLQMRFQNNSTITKLQFQIRDLNDLAETLSRKVQDLEIDKQTLINKIYQLGGQPSDRSDGNLDRSNRSMEEQHSANFQQNRLRRNPQKEDYARQPTNEYILSPTDERLMLQIQSFMRQFERVLDRKQEDKRIASDHNQKVIAAIEGLQSSLN